MEHESLFLIELVIILVFANIGGYVAQKLKQPTVLGQILVGVLIGPGVLNLVEGSIFISNLAEIGVIFLMFIAGLETDIEDLKSSGKSSSAIAAGGVVVPLVLGMGAMALFKPESSMEERLFLGIILTATSVSITVQTLRELKQLRTKVGVGILGAAIIDDVIGIILITLAMGAIKPDNASNIFVVIAQIVGFFVIVAVVGVVFVKLMKKYHSKLGQNNKILNLALIFCFVMSILAEELGVAAIIGAYFTGVVFSTTLYRNRVSSEIQRVAYAMFTPVFFVNIGLMVRFDGIMDSLGLGIAIVVAAVGGKLIGCWVGSRLSHFSASESIQVAIGMIPRAEVALIVTNLGLKTGIIGHDIFTAVILLVLVSTLITPVMLKLAFKAESTEQPG